MNEAELQRYLYTHIPLSKAMQVEVLRVAPETVVLGAPLAPNINHRETLFGGSATAIATLSAWSLVHTRLLRLGLRSRLVIRRNTMEYETPIAGAFEARAFIADEAEWNLFLRALQRKGRGRIHAASVLDYEGIVAARFEGEFVALPLQAI